MNYIVHDIPFNPKAEEALHQLRIKPHAPFADEAISLLEKARTVARPKIIYRESFIQERGDDFVIVEDHRFQSRVLRVNLENTHKVFPYVCTSGREIYQWSRRQEDPLHRFWSDAISEMALRASMQFLNEHIREKYRLEKFSIMSPGSLPDWPIEEQRPLFSLIGDVEKSVGVTLTESLLMVPTKSVSGILFPTEESFESCRLCARDDCPGRVADYEPGLMEDKYSLD